MNFTSSPSKLETRNREGIPPDDVLGMEFSSLPVFGKIREIYVCTYFRNKFSSIKLKKNA